MQLIGLYIRHKIPAVTKLLDEGWYPFGNYPAPERHYAVVMPERSEVQKKAYRFEGLPNLTINCIVGMNGAGKSTLLDVMYRIINNFTCRLLGEERIDNQHGRKLEYAYGVYADLYFEIDGKQYCIVCEDANVKLRKKGDVGNLLGQIEFMGSNDPKTILKDFFYTISTNYSIYSFNEDDYNTDIREPHSINGSWIKGLFHKNDGYLTPIVITPFRESGSIDVGKENGLARQRIVALSILSYAQGSSFIENYVPVKLTYQLNGNYQEYINSTYVSGLDKAHPGLQSSLVIEAFSQAWEKYLATVYQDDMDEKLVDNYNAALFYLGYKTLKICMTYDDYWREFDVDSMLAVCAKRQDEKAEDRVRRFLGFVRAELPQRAEDVLKKVVEEIRSNEGNHITLKIEVCLDYIKSIYEGKGLTWENKDERFMEELIEGKRIESYNDAVRALPPAFFTYDMLFRATGEGRVPDSSWGGLNQMNEFSIEKMSSGERQMLNMISYVLYHIKNIQSIRDDENRVKYHHICLIFDEAELYFHPEYQRKFIMMLIESLGWCHIDTEVIRSIQILVVTHSPFVLSDLFRDNVLYLERGQRQESPEHEIFGANLYQLVCESFFFKESAVGKLANKQLTAWIQYVNQGGWLHNDVLSLIGDPMVRNYIIRKREENRKNM